MDPQTKLWATILGYMILAITISACTSLWIRHHLKKNNLHPRRALKKRYLTLKKRLTLKNFYPSKKKFNTQKIVDPQIFLQNLVVIERL